MQSRLDQEVVAILEARTKRVKVVDALRYATPLLRVKGAPPLKANVEAVMPKLRSTERRLLKDPVKAKIYEADIQKLIDGGCVTKLQEGEETSESWFIPHHLVHHNGEHGLVFNCAFNHGGLSLNEQLLPGPTLGPSLIGVLLWFHQDSVATSGDIGAMFCLMPTDGKFFHLVP